MIRQPGTQQWLVIALDFLQKYGLVRGNQGVPIKIFWTLININVLIFTLDLFYYTIKQSPYIETMALPFFIGGLALNCMCKFNVAVVKGQELFDILESVSKNFWSLKSMTKETQKILARKGRYIEFLPYLYCAGIIDTFLYLIFPLLHGELPYPSIFSKLRSPYYELFYVWQSFTVTLVYMGHIAFDLCFCTLYWTIKCQFELLGERFQRDMNQITNETDPEERKTSESKLIKEFVYHHLKIIRVCDKLNDNFQLPSLIVWATTLLSMIWDFIVITTSFTPATGITVVYYAVMYTYCTVGSDLMEASKNLADAIFSSTWYNSGNISFKKSLIILMLRAQRPQILSIGGFSALEIPVLVSIFKVGYSAFTLLVILMKKSNRSIDFLW